MIMHPEHNYGAIQMSSHSQGGQPQIKVMTSRGVKKL